MLNDNTSSLDSGCPLDGIQEEGSRIPSNTQLATACGGSIVVPYSRFGQRLGGILGNSCNQDLPPRQSSTILTPFDQSLIQAPNKIPHQSTLIGIAGVYEKADISRLKQSLCFKTILRDDGHEVTFRGSRAFIECPFHSDATPSFSLLPDNQYAYCHGCSWQGDIIAYVQKHHNLSFPEALKYLTDRKNLSIHSPPVRHLARKLLPTYPSEEQQKQKSAATDDLARNLSVAQQITESRPSSGRRWKPETIQRLAQEKCLGWSAPNLLFYYSAGEKSREWPGKDTFRWQGETGLWREDKLAEADTVYVTEGETDAISLLDSDFETGSTVVVAAPSATSFKSEWAAKFEGKKVIVAFDNDPAGRSGFQKIAQLLRPHTTNVQWVDLAAANVKDITELFEKTAGSEFLMTIRRCTHEYISPEQTLQSDPVQRESEALATQILPPIVSVEELMRKEIPEPKELVAGLLHQGSKMVLAGGSKSYKTWSLLDLSISVATGTQWWDMDTHQAPVLYINFEIQEAFFKKRLNHIMTGKQLNQRIQHLDFWNLRGFGADLSALRPELVKMAKGGNYGLIIIDPIYKGLGNRDENSAGSIGSLLNEVERLAVETGAAVVFGAHFSKGNQAGKESIDRISGSGVFARDPDSILVMTAHEKEDAYTIEPCLRNFPRMDPFCVNWDFPRMVRNSDLNPRKLKQPGNRLPIYSDQHLLAPLGDKTLLVADWMKQVIDKTEMSESTFRSKKLALEQAGKIKDEGKNKWRRTTPDEEKAILEAKPEQGPVKAPPTLPKEVREQIAKENELSEQQPPPLTQ